MANANLYLDSLDLSHYLSQDRCRRCGAKSCKDLLALIQNRSLRLQDVDLSAEMSRRLSLALDTEGLLPDLPVLQMPRVVAAGLMELNQPGPGDPVLLTCNSALTQQLILAVLSTTVSPFFVLFVDTRGDTLDMALILESFTADRITAAIAEERLNEKAANSPLILPGLASELAPTLQSMTTGFQVAVGPVCAAEMPLYFGERWSLSTK